MAYCIGIDMGATNLRLGLVDTSTGAVLRQKIVLTQASRGQDERVHVVPANRVEFVSTALGDEGRLVGSAFWPQMQYSGNHPLKSEGIPKI